jgi:hypothetical protein
MAAEEAVIEKRAKVLEKKARELSEQAAAEAESAPAPAPAPTSPSKCLPGQGRCTGRRASRRHRARRRSGTTGRRRPTSRPVPEVTIRDLERAPAAARPGRSRPGMSSRPTRSPRSIGSRSGSVGGAAEPRKPQSVTEHILGRTPRHRPGRLGGVRDPKPWAMKPSRPGAMPTMPTTRRHGIARRGRRRRRPAEVPPCRRISRAHACTPSARGRCSRARPSPSPSPRAPRSAITGLPSIDS